MPEALAKSVGYLASSSRLRELAQQDSDQHLVAHPVPHPPISKHPRKKPLAIEITEALTARPGCQYASLAPGTVVALAARGSAPLRWRCGGG